MRKGWFKRARKKFIRKRVYAFTLYDAHHSLIDWSLTIKRNGRMSLRTRWMFDEAKQVVERITGYGTFLWKFQKARSLRFKKPKLYGFYYRKKIEI